MISVNEISKSFGTFKALDKLSFSVGEGEVVGLLGPNGAGKTTSMRIMSGFLSPDSGEVLIDGLSVLEDPISAQTKIGYLPENNPQYKDMLVSEILNFSAELKNISKKDLGEAVDFSVKAVNIEDVYYKPVKELSKGYKQRVGLAIALLHQPKILIMDEPTEGLDPNQRVEIRSLIKRLSADRTIIVSTHVMQEVEALCSRMIIINKGVKVADGSVAELKHGSIGDRIYRVDIEGADVRRQLERVSAFKKLIFDEVSEKRVEGTIVSSPDSPVQPVISQLAAQNGWIIWELSQEKLQLEDVFKNLTRENTNA